MATETYTPPGDVVCGGCGGRNEAVTVLCSFCARPLARPTSQGWRVIWAIPALAALALLVIIAAVAWRGLI